jgi:hypothetical protein
MVEADACKEAPMTQANAVDAPERVWMHLPQNVETKPCKCGKDFEYIRADLVKPVDEAVADGKFFEARIRNQAGNIIYEVFGAQNLRYKPERLIIKQLSALQDLITDALLAAHRSVSTPAPSVGLDEIRKRAVLHEGQTSASEYVNQCDTDRRALLAIIDRSQQDKNSGEAVCDCLERADGIGSMHGHHDALCPKSGEAVCVKCGHSLSYAKATRGIPFVAPFCICGCKCVFTEDKNSVSEVEDKN